MRTHSRLTCSRRTAAIEEQWKVNTRALCTSRVNTVFCAGPGLAVKVQEPSSPVGPITVSPFSYIRGRPHAAYQALVIRESATLFLGVDPWMHKGVLGPGPDSATWGLVPLVPEIVPGPPPGGPTR